MTVLQTTATSSCFSTLLIWAWWYGFGRKRPPVGRSSSGTFVLPDVTISATGGQRLRITRANLSPSMDPGIWISVKTARISFRLSKIRMASSASDASMTSNPASFTMSMALARSRLSSSTTSTTGRLPQAIRSIYALSPHVARQSSIVCYATQRGAASSCCSGLTC
jgi:hypothetical protein